MTPTDRATSVITEIDGLLAIETNRAKYVTLIRLREQAIGLLNELRGRDDSDAA